MKVFNDLRLNKTVYQINIGQTYTTKEPDVVLNTLVGSCISVCMVDKTNGVYGINHFMLPGSNHKHNKDPKYGAYATDLLIEQMVEKGADRKHMEARVFGAGKVIDQDIFEVGTNNANFILKYLGTLKIPIVHSDLGGDYGRNILYFCNTSEVVVHKIANNNSTNGVLEK